MWAIDELSTVFMSHNAGSMLLYDDDKLIKVPYKYCYVIVHNGYLHWSVTVPPMKTTNFRKEIRFPDLIDSMRKDIECSFGVSNGRWRVLRYGIKLWGIQNTDKCC